MTTAATKGAEAKNARRSIIFDPAVHATGPLPPAIRKAVREIGREQYSQEMNR